MGFVTAVVALPNLAAIIVPFEAWPLTNAPMFAADIEHSALYRVRLWLVPREGKRTPLPMAALHMPGWHLERLFLGAVWGAAHPATAIGRFPDDTPAALTARADAFFDAVVGHIQSHEPDVLTDVVSIDVEIDRVAPDKARHRVGNYDLTTRSFTHLWRAP